MDYNEYLEAMVVEIADRQSPEKIEGINLREIHESRFADCPPSWLESLPTELHSRGLGVDWQDTSNESFRPNGSLFALAADIRSKNAAIESSTHVFPTPPTSPRWQFWKREFNWTKWGAIGALLALPTMIVLWWLTQ